MLLLNCIHRAMQGRCAFYGLFLVTAIASLTLAGCDAIPKNAPTADAFERESDAPATFPFRLVGVDAGNIDFIQSAETKRFSTAEFFRDGGQIQPTLGPGDALSITVLEPASGGLFSGIDAANVGGQGAKVVMLPDIQVDSSGTIDFPFVGKVRVIGKTPLQLGTSLAQTLSTKVIQPQVLVRLSANLANKAVIAGAVKVPGEFDVTPAGETLLQLIARAGGPTNPASDSIIRMTRHRVTRDVRLQALVDQPLADVHMKAGDFVNIINVPRTYTMLGALGVTGLRAGTSDFPLPPERLSLAAALGRAGGLDDTRANIKGIFVLRYETRAVADRLAPRPSGKSEFVPVAYQLDFSKAGGMFLAERFTLRERDLVVLSDAPIADADKLLNLFRLVATPVFSGVSTAGSF